MGLPIFQIPGNIKQQFLPFVLNPYSPLHQVVTTSSQLNDKHAQPQYFTYKEQFRHDDLAPLQFYPSSLTRTMVDNDISFKLLYGSPPEGAGNGESTGSLTLQDVLSRIPGVQIREYLPDTRLDQCINMFTDIFKNMAKLVEKKKDTQGKAEKTKDVQSEEQGFMAKLWDVASFTVKFMVGASQPNFFDSFGVLDDMPFSSYNDIYSKSQFIGDLKQSPGYFVMTFPYILYYRLQSCVTTNIYEIPGSDNNKCILNSTGTKGWTDGGNDFMSAGGFRVSGLLSKIPIIGNIANMILGNIGINYMPWWNPEAGSSTREAEIDIEFNLYNDSADAAMYNFIFVNTIAPNNRWLQYNMFQHSPCIYDVKLEGINRLFACACDVDVKYEGTLRDPPVSWLTTLATKHLNRNMNASTFLSNAINYKLIKIPDVYKVSLKFTSLLPSNFNTFLFNYSENASHIVKYGPGTEVYQSSAVSKMISDAMASYWVAVGNVWDGKNPDGTQTNASKQREAAAQEKKQQEEQQKQQQQEYI